MTDRVPIVPELIDVGAVATMLGLHRRTVLRMNTSGLLGPRPLKLGRTTRWRRAELLAWIDAGCPPRVRWMQQYKGVLP